MLKNKIQNLTFGLLRILSTWFFSTLILTVYSFVYSRLNYKYHFNKNWRYELANRWGDLFNTISFGLLILLAMYYLVIFLFPKSFDKTRNRLIFLLVLSFAIFFYFMSMWGNPFNGLDFFEILFAIVKLLLFGLAIFFVDYLSRKFFNVFDKK